MPRKTTQNAYVEDFNGRIRDEYLNETLFACVRHARVELAIWPQDNNHVRPHSAHDGKKPPEISAQSENGLTPLLIALPVQNGQQLSQKLWL